MNILIHSSQIKSFQAVIAEYDSKNFRKNFIGTSIQYKYLNADLEAYVSVRAMQQEGVIFEGFPAYLRMTKLDYDTNEVPVGVTFSEILDENGIGTGVQKKWFEWQPSPTMNRNDNIEVIIPTTYQNQAATTEDFDIFDASSDVAEVMGLQTLTGAYQNDILWILDENDDPFPEPPIDKTAKYFTMNWETEAFDFLHAQRLVNQWFNGLVGASVTDKFNSQTGEEKREIIRWGILSDNSEGKGLIEGTVTNPNKRTSYRAWHVRRLEKARAIRFNAAWSYLFDNFTSNAINTRLGEMLAYELKDYYIFKGASNQSNHLIVNGEINPTFWALFSGADVGYGDNDIASMKTRVEKILDGNQYITPFGS
jgi:hypothetical protein